MAIRRLERHLDGAEHVAAGQQRQASAVAVERVAMRNGDDVLPVFEVGVEFRDQEAPRGLAHIEVLQSLASRKIVHMVVMHMRLHATRAIALEPVADNVVAQQHGA